MITPSYSLSATERVLPRMALDFTTASLDARVTVTRALNTATRVNSSGYIETINANLPRFDYSPVSVGVCKGLLIEETRANLAIKSAEFDDSVVWARTNVDVTQNATNSPDGTSNADKIIETVATGGHIVLQTISPSLTSGRTYTYSVFLKKAEREFAFVVLSGSAFSAAAGVSVNLTTGVASTATGSPVFTQPELAANGFWRVNVTATAASNATGGCSVYLSYNGSWGNRSYLGDGSGIFAYGAQFEEGAFPTSYIPTTTTSLTRNADVVSMTGTNFSDWYNASEGAFMVQGDLFTGSFPGSANLISVVDASLADTMRFWVWSGSANNLRWAGTEGGSNQFDITRAYTPNSTFKISGVYKVNSFATAINGGSVATDPSGLVITSADRMLIGCKTGFTEFMSGHIAKVSYWPQCLINAETQAFSK